MTTEEERYPHPHQLVRKSSDNEDHEDPHDIEVSEITNYTAKYILNNKYFLLIKYICHEIPQKQKLAVLNCVLIEYKLIL